MKRFKFVLHDGSSITAVGADEFVTQLREGSKFDSNCSNEKYMKSFAKRYKIQTGNDIRSGSSHEFTDDLIKFGFIKEHSTENM